MASRRSSSKAASCDPSKQEPDDDDDGVVHPNQKKKSGWSPTATTSAHSPGPALAAADTAVEAKEGERGESGCPTTLISAASTNLAGSSTAPDLGSTDYEPKMDDGDRFEGVSRENGPPSASSGGAATRRPSSATATTAAAPADSPRVPAFNFSFAMGGWLMFYSFGVAKCLLDHGLHKVRPVQQSFIGSSAGSLAAAALALEADIDKIVEQAKTSFIPRAHAARFFGFVYGMFYIGQFLKECLLACLPVEKVPGNTTPPGRLVVVMASVLGWKSIRAREFRDGDDLVDALRCSCACFPLVMPHRFRGKRCFDGFFSEGASAPALDEDEAAGLPTVSISPLYASTASIRPSRYVPLSWIALPPNDIGAIDWLYDLGYRDALFWMAEEGIEHTCSHVSRLSRFSQKRSPAAANARGAAASTLEGSDSSSGSDSDDDGHDHRQTRRAATVIATSTRPAESLDTSNYGGRRDEEEEKEVKPPPCQPSSRADDDGWRGGRSGEKRGEKQDTGGKRQKEGEESEEYGEETRPCHTYYVRPSFALSTCHRRPRRHRHPALDAPRFVPSLQKFVGHGSYHAAADFVFVVFFNVVWRPAAALILLADLLARLLVVSARGFAKDLRPLLRWVTLSLLLCGAALERVPSRPEGLAAALAVAAAVLLRRGDAGQDEWRKAGRCVRALVDFRFVLATTLLPWTGGRGRGGGGRGDAGRARVRSEALERSFMYRAVSFFM